MFQWYAKHLFERSAFYLKCGHVLSHVCQEDPNFGVLKTELALRFPRYAANIQLYLLTQVEDGSDLVKGLLLVSSTFRSLKIVTTFGQFLE